VDKDYIHQVLETYREIEDALSTMVKIDHDQVLHIVVDDLVKKYNFNLDRGNAEWAAAFLKILRYYLTEEEIGHLRPIGDVHTPTSTEQMPKATYYDSRRHICRDDEERCRMARIGGPIPMSCILPKGHQGSHLTAHDVEFG